MSPPTYATTLQAFQMVGILEARASRAMLISDLADRLEVHARTVKRYIDALADVLIDEEGQPRVRRERRDGRAYAVLAPAAGGIAANVFQYAAVHAAVQHLEAVNDPVLGETATLVRDQLRTRLGAAATELAERVGEAFVYVPFGPKDYAGDEAVLDPLVRGALRRHPVEVVYASAGGSVYPATIHPYAIVMYRDGLYVLCGELQKQGRQTRVYSVDRIREAKMVREEHFALPKGFDARKHFAGHFGIWTASGTERVRIAFDADVSRFVEERRWPGFVAWETAGERRVLVLDIPVTPQVVTWVLTWGQNAEVLEPATLREQVADGLRRALAQYGAP